jgi:hypothetical protein
MLIGFAFAGVVIATVASGLIAGRRANDATGGEG